MSTSSAYVGIAKRCRSGVDSRDRIGFGRCHNAHGIAGFLVYNGEAFAVWFVFRTL